MCLAIPGEIVSIAEKDGMRFGAVRFGGITREVCLEYEPDARAGDFVLVHVGFAIARIERDEAARTWSMLEAIAGSDLQSELERDLGPEDRT